MGESVLVFGLDSMEQARVFRAHPAPVAACDALVGQIRAALLFNETVLLTDAMVLDGELFRRLDPHAMAAALGVEPHRLPFAVRATHDDLEGALRAKLRDGEFRWQCARPTPGLEAAARVRAWLEAARRGWFTVTPYRAGGIPALALPSAPEALTRSLPDHAAQLLDLIREQDRRSVAERLIGDFHADAPDVRSMRGVRRVADWYHAAYLEAVAVQNSARWFAVTGAPPRRRDRRYVAVPPSLMTFCETQPPAVYAAARASTRELGRPAHGVPKVASTAFGALAARHAQPALGRVIVGLSARVVLAVATIVAAVLGWATDSDTLLIALGAFALLIASSVPWGELRVVSDIVDVTAGATLSLEIDAEVRR